MNPDGQVLSVLTFPSTITWRCIRIEMTSRYVRAYFNMFLRSSKGQSTTLEKYTNIHMIERQINRIGHLPIEESSKLVLQPVMYKIYSFYQGNGYLKSWAFFSWEENGECSKYNKCNGYFNDELCRRSSEPISYSLHNT